MTAALLPLVSALALVALAGASPSPGFRHVPGIPAGRRAEYYLQKAGGGYLFGYDTGDSAAHSHAVEADAANELRGRYQYTDAASGRRLGVSYTAGRRGFRPTSVDVAAGGAVSGSATGGAAVATPRADAAGASDAGSVDADYDANADASYSFSIDTDSYKRAEAADRRGNVRGRYSYNSPRGGSHALSYVAGEGTGFVVTSEAGKSAEASADSGSAAASGAAGSSGAGGYSFSYSADDHSRQEAADASNKVRGSYSFRAKGDGATRRVDYEAGADTGFVARGSHLPVAPTLATIAGYAVPLVPSAPAVQEVAYSAPAVPAPYTGPPADVKSSVHPDGSYSFSFSADDHSRQETADAKNNVRGSYSFRSKDDGVTRKVEYSAGAATGFVASGEHLPVAPPLPSGVAPAVVSAYSAAEAVDGAEDETPGDASYEFSYDAGSHSRQESSDAAGNVRGRFSFVANDGVTRHVDYEAGAKKGFIAKGAHLPVPPSGSSAATTHCASCSPSAASGYSFSYSTEDQSRDEQGDAAGNVRGSYSFTAKDDGKARHVDYSAGANTGFLATGAHLPSVAAVSSAGEAAGAAAYSGHGSGGAASDGSYSFSYSTDDHSRQESADAHNNVRGSYSFVAKDDKKSRTVEYEAGANTGFVARGSHLPGSGASVQGTEEVAAPAAAAAYSAHSSAGAAGYSFSYSTDDHSREETGDAHNNVRGRFSFVAKDDGQRRTVEYEAGAGKGFVARGAHLPQPVAPVPGAGLPVEPAADDAAPEVADTRASASGDASYSYSYETDSSSKTESADAGGNVRGSYSYRTPGGAKRTFRYKSHGAEGFVVTGVEDSGTADVTAPAATAHAQAVAAATHAQTPAATALAQSPVSRIVAGVGAGQRLVLRQYLPPENSHKFGYILDTQERR